MSKKKKSKSKLKLYAPLGKATYTSIKVGHVNYGMRGLQNPGAKPMYITWLRDPLQMLLSLTTYLLEKKTDPAEKTLKAAVNLLIEKLHNPFRLVSPDRIYTQYAAYFRTNGTHGTEAMSLTHIRQEISNNLKNFAVIGVLEEHDKSISLLQHVIDPMNTLRQIWQRPREPSNKSVIPGVTKELILKEIKKNEKMWKDVQKALEFEYSIYNFGVMLYKEQLKKYHIPDTFPVVVPSTVGLQK